MQARFVIFGRLLYLFLSRYVHIDFLIDMNRILFAIAKKLATSIYMHLSDFHYELPDTLIARYPSSERSGSRLLTLDRKTGAISHHSFIDIVDFLHPGDLLVCNDSRVIHARLYGQKETGGQVEILVERILDSHRILAHIRASKSPHPGNILQVNEIRFEMLARVQDLFELVE